MTLMNGSRRLEAWEAVSADEGVTTRRRSAKIEAAALSRSQASESSQESSGKENEVECAERSQSRESDTPAVVTTELQGGNKPARGLRVPRATLRPCTKPKWEYRSVGPAVTTCDQNVSTSKSAADNGFQIYEDPEVLAKGSLKHTSDSPIKDIAEQCTVLETGVAEQILTPPAELNYDLSTNNTSLSTDDTSSDSNDSHDTDMDRDSSSDVTATSGPEAINQLKAMNEDLMAEKNYYRLMAEISTKVTTVQRGYLRTAIQPSSLSPKLSILHHTLTTEGLMLPNSATDRAQVLADVIELHLTWEAEFLKLSINASAAVNNFVEFAASFIPQIQGLAIAEFVGGEETSQVRFQIAAIVLRLVGWIVEQTVVLAETVPPQYLADNGVGWYVEGKRALSDLDTCLEAVCQQKMRSFPEATMPQSYGQVPGLYSHRILQWAYMQLAWINNMVKKLDAKINQAPDQYGVKMQLFGLTIQALRTHLRQGKYHLNETKEIAQAEALAAMDQSAGDWLNQ